jgi:hypothetical protein
MFFVASCYYDNEEELYPVGSTTCVTTTMSFKNDVVKVLNDNGCISCHGAVQYQGNVSLVGYSEVLKYVKDSSLVGSIKHRPQFKAMPQNGPKIGDCSISKIEAWIAQGSADN